MIVGRGDSREIQHDVARRTLESCAQDLAQVVRANGIEVAVDFYHDGFVELINGDSAHAHTVNL